MSLEFRPPRRSRRRSPATSTTTVWVARVVMTIVCIVWITPAFGALLNTFRPGDDVNGAGWWTVFSNPGQLSRLSLNGLDQALGEPVGLGRAMLNSAAVSIPATIVPMIISTVTAYALVFMRFRGRRFVYTVLITLLMVPNQVAVLPLTKLYVALGVQGTIPALWVVLTAFAIPLNTYLLRTYLLRLRTEIVDCARMDGAGELQILWRIVTPLAAPALSALSVFQFLASWNELFLSLSFLGGGGETATAPMVLTGSILSLQTLSAAGVLTVVVPVAVFLLLQGRLLDGLTHVTRQEG